MMRRGLYRGVFALKSTFFVRFYTDAKIIRKPNEFDQVVDAQNEAYVEGLLRQYEKDPALVAPSWIPLLRNLQAGNVDTPLVPSFHRPSPKGSLTERERMQNMSLSWMIRAYEKVGHYVSSSNTLQKLGGARALPFDQSLLDPSSFGFTEEDLQRAFKVTFGSDFEATFVSGETSQTLKDIVAQLRLMYCGPIGFQFMSSGYFDLRNWFRHEILNSMNQLERQDRISIFEDVVRSCVFDQFFHSTYSSLQHFALDGCEALIPIMKSLIQAAADYDVTSCVLGMAHRGRLNVLCNVLQKSPVPVFSEFEDKVPKNNLTRFGDLRYNLGHRKKVSFSNGKFMDIELMPNAVHAEIMNPATLGKVRARQVYEKDSDCTNILPIIIHGYNAIRGQGCCYETMGLCGLDNFNVGGTVHIIINNEITFKEDFSKRQGSIYCSDISKVNNSPVLHVNGDDVEACVRASRIAIKFRQEFHRDIIVNILCNARNVYCKVENLEFTHPQYCQDMSSKRNLLDIYGELLVREGLLTDENVQSKKAEYEAFMAQSLVAAERSQEFVNVKPYFQLESENQAETLPPVEMEEIIPAAVETGVDIDTLRAVGIKITTIPNTVKKAHPVLQRTYAARKKAIESGEGVEWCLGELLAFGTLSLEGVSIRLTGEDVERGTFTQRHAAVIDQETNVKVIPVSNLSVRQQAPVTICNSSLSELAVCGFEFGYSTETPSNLCMWEAQFGDFANGAQPVIDDLIATCEEKWGVKHSLILSLPHGYSGAGPEHSSARIERYLLLCSDADVVPPNFRQDCGPRMLEARVHKNNWQVCYPSTPANYFHMLRRQVVRNEPKPLVFFFSKARLRAPNVSSLAEMATGTAFLPVIDTAEKNDLVARKVLFCTGQIESIVDDRRRKLQASQPNVHNDVVIVKIEQLSPFPWEQVADVLEKYYRRNPDVEFAWLQEEPKNMGPWAYMRPRFNSLMKHLGISKSKDLLKYIGRPSAASPSTGYGSVHVEEEKELVEQALA